MNQIISQLTDFFLQYSLKQRLIIAGVLVAFLSIVIALVLWANKTEYDLLYANLDPAEASEIVTSLNNDKIKYRLENGGTTIYVQQDMADEMRIRFRAQGFGSNTPKGWDDIFSSENSSMGETTTITNMKIKRALEGELMKTLNMMTWIKSSRVHLNIPQRRLFDDESRGSASVYLTLNHAMPISDSQLKGIPALVANSVDGVKPEDVIVVDSAGNLLYSGEEGVGVGQSGNQWELTRNIEKELKTKVRSLIETAVGFGNASVQVAAELNFDQVQQTIEDIDPDDVTVLSEEIYSESQQDNADSSAVAVENSTTNYEFSKVVRNIIQGTGNVKRLSVSVAVNGRYDTIVDENGNETQQYVPRSPEEIEALTTLVKGAVNFNEDRGDVVNVIHTRFADPPVYEDNFMDEFTSPQLWKDIIYYIVIALAMFMAFRLLKGILTGTEVTKKILLPLEMERKRAQISSGEYDEQKKLKEAEEEFEAEMLTDSYMKKLSPEARAKMRAKDKMTREVLKFTGEKPDQATNLLRAWLMEANQR